MTLSGLVQISETFIQFLNNSNLEQLITEHTRFRLNQTPSTLDLLRTNSSQLNWTPQISISVYAVTGTSIQTIDKSNTIFKLKKVINYSNLDQKLASVDRGTSLSKPFDWFLVNHFFQYHSELYLQKFIFDKSSLESEETLDQKLHVTNEAKK